MILGLLIVSSAVVTTLHLNVIDDNVKGLEKSIESVSKTNRCLVVHEDKVFAGFGGELVALINEKCFESLDAPILRVAAKDSHVAYCPTSEDYILPQVDDVYNLLKKLLSY